MRIALIVLGVVAALAIGLLVTAELYWSAMYVEEEITTGEGWNVVIGESAVETIGRLQKKDSARKARLLIYRSVPPTSELIDPLSSAVPEKLEGAHQIVVLGSNPAISDLTIDLKDGRVVRVHMRQRGFDL